MKLCSEPGCGRKHFGRGWCNTHYRRWYDRTRRGDAPTVCEPKRLSVAECFWRHVEKTEGCWFWRGHVGTGGYGKFSSRHTARFHHVAHRFAYELTVGPVPDGLELDHLCRVRHCVNPAHLEPVTPRENLLRSSNFVAVNARKTHCVHGHPLSGDNVYVRKSDGGRICRTCERNQWRKQHEKRRAARAVAS